MTMTDTLRAQIPKCLKHTKGILCSIRNQNQNYVFLLSTIIIKQMTIMTNREIKFELVKLALTQCNFMSSDSLTDSLKNLYDWIVEEPEVDVKESNVDVEKPNIDYNKTSIREIIKYISKDRNGIGYTSRLIDAFNGNNINSIGDLLRLGRRGFSSIKGVGNGCVTHVDDALEGLYGIVNWNK